MNVPTTDDIRLHEAKLLVSNYVRTVIYPALVVMLP